MTPSHSFLVESKRRKVITVSLALKQTPVYTARPQSVPVYAPAFAGTNCAYPWRDGQAELTWVTGYIPRWFTHP